MKRGAPTLAFDTCELLDHLLDARKALLSAQELSGEGAPIWKAMQRSIKDTDEALRIARTLGKATKV